MRWMCGVSLKDRKCSEVIYSFLDILCVAEVVKHGRLRWFGQLEHKSGCRPTPGKIDAFKKNDLVDDKTKNRRVSYYLLKSALVSMHCIA